ncbi:CLUMA_CG018880, isoform A [Clunio marinus]|uniref:CLUMA_CG018880, isoform A n=1 Tax=Clunio marinus TaxID=568069 RepID=A0A1J1J5L8_9DIPT|nr:CLUMA_CG018880, isoform A [Clunio marinus]
MDLFITTIGQRSSEFSESDATFFYNHQEYKQLIDWHAFDKLLQLHRRTGFYLKSIPINGIDNLLLFYTNAYGIIFDKTIRREKKFLIDSIFEIYDEKIITEPVAGSSRASEERELTLENFYERLRQKHEFDDLETDIPQNVQHKHLRPLLRPYQVKGIKWLLKRELITDYLKPCYVKMQSKFNKNQTLFYNKYTQEIILNSPLPHKIPPGGFLTDEMGLGKTVEIIALMLMNPRKGVKRGAEEIEDVVEMQSKKPELKCICFKNVMKQKLPNKKLIRCIQCLCYQHLKCVFSHDVTEESFQSYICPFCWKSSGRIIQSSATIIVTPLSIKSQWKDEIMRHVSDKSFKTLMYDGITHGWVSPTELATYDAVITDFTTLSRELYFAETFDRSLRHSKKFEYPTSPLACVQWWRVVLDEAQMVEKKCNRPSQMVKKLLAVNRWATTGTPIEKDSIRCLYGLIFFFNLEPYANENIFDQLWNEYRSGSHDEMINIVSTVMWRTCKKNVENEINIPKQTEIVHKVEMSDLQKYFYGQAHLKTKLEFLKSVQDYLLRNGPVTKVNVQIDGKTKIRHESSIDLSMKDKFLYQFNNANLRVFLEPLKRLRQDCTIPSAFGISKNAVQLKFKKPLKPEQLHEYLTTKVSLNVKSALRGICSSINAIAGIKIATEDYDEARKLYKDLLKLAKDYNNGFVTVDSMLQIHAYQGLIDIAMKIEDSEELAMKKTYNVEMGRLEWKYVSNFYDKVKVINNDLMAQENEMKETRKGIKDANWWLNIVNSDRTHEYEAKLIDVINLELLSNVSSGLQYMEHLRTKRGVQMVLLQWFDKIGKHSNDVKRRFDDLKFIVKNLRPSNEMNDGDREKVSELAKVALSCHLNLADLEEDDQMNRETTRKGFCKLCVLKSKLNEYECVLFNKTLVEAGTDGSWNPRFEENLLKTILNYAKRFDFEDEIISTGNKFFKCLECLKSQFKLLAKLWVEVNYTVSALDEINMCKMRLEVVESPDEITSEDCIRNGIRIKITRHEVDDHLAEFHSEKHEAELNFARLNGRLKYLEHLKQQNEPPMCPICTNNPKEKYFVTICGHTICAECLEYLVGPAKRYLTCPTCRTKQELNSINSVTLCDNNSTRAIEGSYSPKIDEVLRSILMLKEKEADVKILLFSHWDSILKTISRGLDDNAITFRSSLASKFSKQIEDFKNFSKDVTVLLLNLKFGGKGLNLIEATHVFLVEPILNADEELQAIGRVHRIGQTRETFVHRFITNNTIEDTIYNKIISEKHKWMRKEFTIKDLEELFNVDVKFTSDNINSFEDSSDDDDEII